MTFSQFLGLSPAYKTPSPGNVKKWEDPNYERPYSPKPDKKYTPVLPHPSWTNTIPSRKNTLRPPQANRPQFGPSASSTHKPSSNEILIILAYFGVALFIIGPIIFMVVVTFNKKCEQQDDSDESRVLNQRASEENIKHSF